MRMTEANFINHTSNRDGYCYHCDAITVKGDVDIDAEEELCPRCKKETLLGMDTALVSEYFEF